MCHPFHHWLNLAAGTNTVSAIASAASQGGPSSSSLSGGTASLSNINGGLIAGVAVAATVAVAVVVAAFSIWKYRNSRMHTDVIDKSPSLEWDRQIWAESHRPWHASHVVTSLISLLAFLFSDLLNALLRELRDLFHFNPKLKFAVSSTFLPRLFGLSGIVVLSSFISFLRLFLLSVSPGFFVEEKRLHFCATFVLKEVKSDWSITVRDAHRSSLGITFSGRLHQCIYDPCGDFCQVFLRGHPSGDRLGFLSGGAVEHNRVCLPCQRPQSGTKRWKRKSRQRLWGMVGTIVVYSPCFEKEAQF